MRIAIPALFLCAILALLCSCLQRILQGWIQKSRERVFAAPIALSIIFGVLLWAYGIPVAAPAALIVVYTFAPAVAAFLSWDDFVIILLLWLPLEFSLGASVIPKAQQGFFHTVAYGIAILLALWLFLIFRDLPGMKYNPPRAVRDWTNPLIGYAIVAPILIPIGLWIGFIQPFHIPPNLTGGFVLSRFLLILAATALPEEILFRSLIQNCVMRRLGFTNWALLLSAVIFGCAHLNNGSGPLPNWRYAIMATIAGFAYGNVFSKSGSVFSSAILHALVNTSKHVFF